MTATATPSPVPADPAPRRYPAVPPSGELSTVALGLVIIGGILMAAYAPRRPPLVLPTLLAIAATVLLAVAWVLLLGRLSVAAKRTFFRFFRWALLAYVISAGVILYAFVHNHVRGAPLAVVTWLLVLFGTSVPTIIAFTVARYDRPLAPSL